ncbi:MAG TPA: iron ABC transporter substrate-binding protein, partial [Afipia sp.]
MPPLLRRAKPAIAAAISVAITFGTLGTASAVDLTDQRNRTITFDKLPERLVFLPIPAPSTFMTIDGSDKKIVGMNDYSA